MNLPVLVHQYIGLYHFVNIELYK